MGKHDYTIHIGTWEKPENDTGLVKTFIRKQEGKKDVTISRSLTLDAALGSKDGVKELLLLSDIDACKELVRVIPEELSTSTVNQ